MKNRAILALTIRFTFFVMPSFAHHGGSEYDPTKMLSLQATVRDFQFVNPHALIDFDVKDGAGKVTDWQGELSSPNLLVRRGWSKNVLKAADQVTIIGHPAKNGQTGMKIERVVFPDGRELSSALPSDSSK